MSTLPKKKNKKTIIIAEDDKGISKALSQLLENTHYIVEVVVDGQKIVDHMERILPDLLLLDVSMPGIDGRDICIQLKKNKLVKHIPIIMMSANNDVKKMAEEACADDFIAKPFDIFVLLQKIEKFLA